MFSLKKLTQNRCYFVGNVLAAFGIILMLGISSAPLFAKETVQPYSAEFIQRVLGWVSDANSVGLCPGYYQDMPLSYEYNSAVKDQSQVINLKADSTSYSLQGDVDLKGHVQATEVHREVSADQATVHRDKKTQRFESLDLLGHVRYYTPGQFIFAERAHILLGGDVGTLYHALYRLLMAGNVATEKSTANVNLNAYGEAERIDRWSAVLTRLSRATYSACPPTQPAWHLSAKHIFLDKIGGRGLATHAVLHLGKIPVLYSPLLSFPIDQRRKSGFLFPNVAFSSSGGLMFAAPYYFNIAPNTDGLFSPRLFLKRGLLLDNKFRFLTPNTLGEINFSMLPNDREFRHFKGSAANTYVPSDALNHLESASAYRRFVAWHTKTDLDPHWSLNIDYNKVSDDYFFTDLGTPSGVNFLYASQLMQQGTLQYTSDAWRFLVLMQQYQTLHPVNQPAFSDQYRRLPELALNYDPVVDSAFTYHVETQIARFQHSPGTNIYTNWPYDQGLRWHGLATVAYPWEKTYASTVPTIGVDMTQYQTIAPSHTVARDATRILPFVSVDNGIYLDKPLTLGQFSYRQTLEPRAYYLWIPYQNQDKLPLFDTTLPFFNFDQLFANNRFSGVDRLGDANQLSLSLTSRLLSGNTGEERLQASVGSILYFEDRRVPLCASAYCVANGVGNPTDTISPIAGQLVYKPSNQWDIRMNTAWDTHDGAWNTWNASLQYKPDDVRVGNMIYNYARSLTDPSGLSDLKQLGLSFAWPIHYNWRALGSWYYNQTRQYTQTYLAGVEYDSCCWAIRVVADRQLTGFLQPAVLQGRLYDNRYYVQWQLKTLGSLSVGNVNSLLQQTIPGIGS